MPDKNLHTRCLGGYPSFRLSVWRQWAACMLFFFIASFYAAFASDILFKEDFEGMEKGETFLFNPSRGQTFDSKSFSPEVGRMQLRVGNNAEISEGLAGSSKSLKIFDSEAEGAGGVRILCGFSDKTDVSQIHEKGFLKISFDARFDGEFTRTLFEFQVHGYDAAQEKFDVFLMYVTDQGGLCVTNSAENTRTCINLPVKLFENPPEDVVGIAYHFEFVFDLKKGSYGVTVYANGDRATPFFSDEGLACVTKNPATQTELEYFDEYVMNFGGLIAGSSGTVTVDNLLVENVSTSKSATDLK